MSSGKSRPSSPKPLLLAQTVLLFSSRRNLWLTINDFFVYDRDVLMVFGLSVRYP